MNRIINKDTAIPIGAAILLAGAAAGYAVTINKQDAFNTKILDRIDALTQSQYTLPAAAEKAARDALMNPNQVVADPRDPNRVMPNAAGIAYMRGIQEHQ